jgi:hypothetical protein
MAGNPITQNYTVRLQTSIPSSILGQSSISFLNAIGTTAWNDTIGGVLTLEHFVGAGLDVSSSSVTGATWIANGGNAELDFTLNTVSDPVTASGIQLAIEAAFGLLVVAIGGAIALLGPPGWAWDALGGFLILIGAIALLSVSVTLLTSTTAGSVLFYGAVIVGGGLLAFAAYEYFKKP